MVLEMGFFAKESFALFVEKWSKCHGARFAPNIFGGIVILMQTTLWTKTSGQIVWAYTQTVGVAFYPFSAIFNSSILLN